MSLDNTKLLDFLGEVDKELSRKIVVVAIGGTAMTLVKAKPSTIDVDFTIPGEFYDEFTKAKNIVNPGFRVDSQKISCIALCFSIANSYQPLFYSAHHE